MTLTSSICELRGVRAVRFKAVIGAKKKLGLKRSQKTWTIETCAPEFSTKELMPSIEAEAKRWEERVMAKVGGEKGNI